MSFEDNEFNRNNSISQFMSRLSPGIGVALQYDDRPPANGTFQGFEDRNVILTDYDSFPGLVRIAPDRINAVAPFSGYRNDAEDDNFTHQSHKKKLKEFGPTLYF